MVNIEDGKIVTELTDLSFFELVWVKWARYDKNEVNGLRRDLCSNEMTDEVLRDEGFFVLRNTYSIQGNGIFLHKTGYKCWMVKDDHGNEYTSDELEEFVDELLMES